MIAKSDALAQENNDISGIYMIIPATRNMIAKSDAKFVEINLISKGYERGPVKLGWL